jgi:FkbM family methyltransferase
MKHRLRAAYDRLRFRVAARFGTAFGWFYRRFHTPRPGSLGDLLSTLSCRTPEPLTVLQVGANDGLKWDPLHKFIRRDRWRGILLEPQTPVFRDWLEPLHARNPRITTVNAALGPEDGQMNLYRIGFSRARWATGLASFQREQIERVIESPHVRRHAAKEGVVIPDDPRERIAADPVEVLSIATLLQRHPLERLDLLFVDTEGFDFEIVKLFDLRAPGAAGSGPLRPRMIVYENAHLSDDDAAACVDLLRAAQYRVGELGPNSFAVAEEVLSGDPGLAQELARFGAD